MAVLVIGGEKGGTGKSTTAVNLSIMASLMKRDVILVDATIKQASSAKLINRRNELGIKPTPPCVRIQGKYLHEELRDLNNRYQDVVVDTGGFDSVELRSAMAAPCVTKMYSPLKASEFDLETLETINELVYLSKSYNPQLNCHVFFNQVPTTPGGADLIGDASKLVQDFEYLMLAKTAIYHRISIQTAAANAQCVIEYEEERRRGMAKYRVKDYLYKGSLEFCSLYKEAFEEDFTSEMFSTLQDYMQNNQKAETA